MEQEQVIVTCIAIKGSKASSFSFNEVDWVMDKENVTKKVDNLFSVLKGG